MTNDQKDPKTPETAEEVKTPEAAEEVKAPETAEEVKEKPKKEKAPKEPKAPKDSTSAKTPKKKNFFDKAWDFLGAVGRKPWFRIAQIVLATLLVLLLVFYGASTFFANKSGFTVQVEQTKAGQAAISLSEDEDFSTPTVRLNAGGVKSLTNISELDLPEQIDGEGGAHHGANYFAYTFYMKNSGEADADIRSELNIISELKDFASAVRVKVYRNGTPTTYAKLGANGEPEYNTTPFTDDETVYSVVEENVNPEEIIKYTIVIWLEGDDPECLDNIKGGNVKMSLTFSVEEAET